MIRPSGSAPPRHRYDPLNAMGSAALAWAGAVSASACLAAASLAMPFPTAEALACLAVACGLESLAEPRHPAPPAL